MAKLDADYPYRAYHRHIQYILKQYGNGSKIIHEPAKYEKINVVFKRMGGSWEGVFKGNPDDITLLKKAIKIAIKKKIFTPNTKLKP